MPSRNQKRSAIVSPGAICPRRDFFLAAIRGNSGRCLVRVLLPRKLINLRRPAVLKVDVVVVSKRSGDPPARQQAGGAHRLVKIELGLAIRGGGHQGQPKLNVQALLNVDTNFTRRKTDLKTWVLAACCSTRLEASSCNVVSAGKAQSRNAESRTSSGRSCSSAVSMRTKSAVMSLGARCSRASASSPAADRSKSATNFCGRESAAVFALAGAGPVWLSA